jgi:aryl-phospho-beta-D-glucosidase BglC (GH1 family)
MQNEDSTISTDVDREIARVNRRDLLKYLGSSALLAALPAFKEPSLAAAATHERGAAAASPSINPKWYGFNLLEYFSTDPDWMKYFPYRNDGMFLEDDFRWIRDWGFNWVRLPMDYRFWTDPKDLLKFTRRRSNLSTAPFASAIKLSFNLVNEPLNLNGPAEITELTNAGKSADDAHTEVAARLRSSTEKWHARRLMPSASRIRIA